MSLEERWRAGGGSDDEQAADERRDARDDAERRDGGSDRGDGGSSGEDEHDEGEHELGHTFDRAVEDGEFRLRRSWPNLLATGTVGGIDVGVGLLAALVVEEATGSVLLGALAFSIGFIALALANSELFTENFFVPVAATAAGRTGLRPLLRLWSGTLVMNLVGGWVMAFLIISAFPHLDSIATEKGVHWMDHSLGWDLLAAGILGGTAITLMTWMEHSTESVPAKLAAVTSVAFLLMAAPLNHSVVNSLEIFAAMIDGAPFGYLDWLPFVGWSVLGNVIGGLGMVTALRLVQVGREKVEFGVPISKDG